MPNPRDQAYSFPDPPSSERDELASPTTKGGFITDFPRKTGKLTEESRSQIKGIKESRTTESVDSSSSGSR
jgi:hypothetical protein